MVQMKVTASVLIVAAAIAPAVAYGFEAEDSLVTRDDNEFASVYGRGLELGLDEREFDEELYEREPFRGLIKGARRIFRGGNRLGGSAPSTPTERREFDDELLEREFDEDLYEREPFRGMGMVRGARRIFRGGNRLGGSAPSTPTERREFDDEILEREFDEELYEREPLRGMVRGARRIFRGGNRLGGSAPSTPTERREFDDELLEREFDEELYEREPLRGMGMVRGARRIFRGGNRLGGSAPSTPTERREFDEDLLEREYDSELFEREPEPLFGFIKKLFRKKKAPAPDASAEAREIDELD